LSSASTGGYNVYVKYAYNYDPMGRPTAKNFDPPGWTGSGLQASAGSYGDYRDLAGNITTTNNGAGISWSITRDNAGRATSVTSNTQTTGSNNGVDSNNIFLNATYTSLNAPSIRLLGNGLTDKRQYDNRGRLISSSQAQTGSSIGYSLTTGYDHTGNVTSSADSVNGTWTYGYDSLNRLHTGSSSTGLNLDWEYDSFGNRKSQSASGTGSAPQVSFTYTNSQNRADSSSGIVYDAAGNVLVDSLGQHYTYDAEERITSMSSSTESATYEYDSEGNLVFEAGTSGTREFLRNSAGQPVQIYRDGTYPTYPAYVDGEFIGSWYNSVFNWAGKNQVGTKNYVSWGIGDANSTAIPKLIGAYTSLPFGDNLSSIGDDPLHFTGKERDAESNLDYFGARHYSSTMGRFMTPDPSALDYADPSNPQSLNLYAYVQNNPLVNFDPDGLDCFTTSNLTSTSVTVTTYVGATSCDGIAGGKYVDGTINTSSYGAAVGSDGDVHVSFSFTPSDASSISGSDGGTATMQGPGWGSTDIGAAVQGDGSMFSMSQDDRIQALAQAENADSQHSIGCIAQAYGAGAPGETMRYMGQPVEGSKPFVGNASKGTSPISEFLSAQNWKLPKGTRFPAPTGGPFTGKNFAMKGSRNLGRQLGRWAPIVGWAADGYAASKLWGCLGR
jgi:RHS repeat-associated protein